jgi:hypothetical protein
MGVMMMRWLPYFGVLFVIAVVGFKVIRGRWPGGNLGPRVNADAPPPAAVPERRFEGKDTDHRAGAKYD